MPYDFFDNFIRKWESFTEAEHGDEFDSSGQIRPSIALVSAIEVTGSGTSDDPYVVE